MLLPLLESDLYPILLSCVDGSLRPDDVTWRRQYAVAVVLASSGYPGPYPKGKVIEGLETMSRTPGTVVYHAGTKFEGGKMVTAGGRVLAVSALGTTLKAAADAAYRAVEQIGFEGVQYRKDIARTDALRQHTQKGLTYESAGVSIQNADVFVDSIKALVSSSLRSGCIGSIGGFGALFDLAAAGYKDPILVSGTDGVGTKLMIAKATGRHAKIGIDLVAMCVNDILMHGAEPLFFLDYFATGKLDPHHAKTVLEGIVEGCQQAGCALVGGETAEMPGMYGEGSYDLAGFAVGAMEKAVPRLPITQDMREGDVLLGIPSSGIHSNGFSLVRKVVSISGSAPVVFTLPYQSSRMQLQ